MADRQPREVPVMRKPAVRFAPSPNGYLHLGHAFSALFAAEFARVIDARFILRIEDIDTTRTRPQFVAQILDDLAWLGLEWEEPVRRQSAHMADYWQALEQLKERGLVYATRASRREIADFVAARDADGSVWPRDPEGAPLFPGMGRVEPNHLSGAAIRIDMKKALAEVEGRRLSFIEIGPERGMKTPVPADPGKWGDVVLARRDIATSYHLSVVVDDALQGITHVTRGMDLFQATHVHRLLQKLLEKPTPIYCHHPLIEDAYGRKLAKTRASISLRELRQKGASAEDIRTECGIDGWRAWLERQDRDMVSRTFPD